MEQLTPEAIALLVRARMVSPNPAIMRKLEELVRHYAMSMDHLRMTVEVWEELSATKRTRP